jgi:membrane protein DedA with SNARE-associated domain
MVLGCSIIYVVGMWMGRWKKRDKKKKKKSSSFL